MGPVHPLSIGVRALSIRSAGDNRPAASPLEALPRLKLANLDLPFNTQQGQYDDALAALDS